MKQHITVKQLNELSEKGKKKYYDWCWKNKYWSDYPGWKSRSDIAGANKLSVGQMIEFLDECNPKWEGINIFHMPGGELDSPKWIITPNYLTKHFLKECWRNKELIDALWQAVKEVLNR